MVHLLKIESVSGKRSFTNGRGEQRTAIELEMTQGVDRIVCSAFEKMADVIEEMKLVKGTLVWCDLRFYVGGSEKKFQSVKLSSIALF